GGFIAKDDVQWRSAKTVQPLMPRRQIHVAAVFDGRAIRLYMDGKLQQTADVSGKYRPGRDYFRIGLLPPSAQALRRPFLGGIDELRVSKIARYTADFTPQTRFEPDQDTLALYH